MSYDLKLENGDLKIDTTGDIAIIQNSEKLKQDGIKMLITATGANKMHTWYGSNISKTLIGNVFDVDFALDAAKQQILSSLENLQLLQKQQALNQNVTPAETIVAIQEVYINNNYNDPRMLGIKVNIISKALTVIPLTFTVKII